MRMLLMFVFVFTAGSLFARPSACTVPLSAENFTEFNRKVSYEKGEAHLNGGQDYGLLWLNGSRFGNGTLEFEVKDTAVQGQSFVEMAFYSPDNTTFEAVYFRPFNFLQIEWILLTIFVKEIFESILMKPNSLLLLFLSLVTFACNKQSKDTSTSESDSDTTGEMKVMIPAQTCYMGTIGRDSIFLKTERFPNVVTGTLEYKNYEKDRSSGTIDGKMNGDTLLADYTFTSEGIESVAQVVFLLQGNTAIEGYGDKEEKDGKMVFKSLDKISFDKSVILNKTECHH